MGKFFKVISSTGNAQLKRRAGIIDRSARRAQETLINTLTAQHDNLKLKLYNLTDFGPSTSISLRPNVKGDWNANEWAAELQKVQEDIYDIEIQLNIAKKTQQEWFSGDPEDIDDAIAAGEAPATTEQKGAEA